MGVKYCPIWYLCNIATSLNYLEQASICWSIKHETDALSIQGHVSLSRCVINSVGYALPYHKYYFVEKYALSLYTYIFMIFLDKYLIPDLPYFISQWYFMFTKYQSQPFIIILTGLLWMCMKTLKLTINTLLINLKIYMTMYFQSSESRNDIETDSHGSLQA